jgi:hypothetical protein
MYVHVEATYTFYLPYDYDELKVFEANEDLTNAVKTEDTIATRYTVFANATYPYKPKERSKR